MSLETYRHGDPLHINCWIYLDLKKYRKRVSQYVVGSMPIGIPISCLKTWFPMVKYHCVLRNEIASIDVCLVKYLLTQPSNVQQVNVFEKPM